MSASNEMNARNIQQIYKMPFEIHMLVIKMLDFHIQIDSVYYTSITKLGIVLASDSDNQTDSSTKSFSHNCLSAIGDQGFHPRGVKSTQQMVTT